MLWIPLSPSKSHIFHNKIWWSHVSWLTNNCWVTFMFIWFSMIWKSSPGWGILPASILDQTWKWRQSHIERMYCREIISWMKLCCFYRHVIQCNLKGSCADKLSLNSWRMKANYFRSLFWEKVITVEEEEGHHAGVNFVVKQPLSPARSRLTHAGKRVKAGDQLSHWTFDKSPPG